jgi:hypothetical protein
VDIRVYRFEGIDRTLVVDITIGVGQTDDANKLSVTQFIRFISLDGVDWNDPHNKETLYVGRAILDHLERTKSDLLQPVRKDTVPRVVGSSALKLYDHNLIVLPRALVDEGTPVIINNACASRRRRIFSLVARELMSAHFFRLRPQQRRRSLSNCWTNMPANRFRRLYGQRNARSTARVCAVPILRPVFTRSGCAIGDRMSDGMKSRLSRALAGWKKTLSGIDPNDHTRAKVARETIAYYEQELAHFRKWRGK